MTTAVYIASVIAIVLGTRAILRWLSHWRARRSLGPPHGGGLHEGDEVTLEGELVADEPITGFDGGAAIVTSATLISGEGEPWSVCDQAATVALRIGEGKIAIRGPLALLRGSDETLVEGPLPARPQIAERVRAVDARVDRGLNHLRQVVSIRPGTRVRIRAAAVRERDSLPPGDYRSHPERWALAGDAIVTVVQQPRLRWRRHWVRASLWGAVLVAVPFVVVPLIMKVLATVAQNTINHQLTHCQRVDDEARRARTLARIAGACPWIVSEAELQERLRHVLREGVRHCTLETGPPPVDMIDANLALAGEDLPVDERARHDALLLTLGYEARVVASPPASPAAGTFDGEPRIRAHLLLGDVAGASEVWREGGSLDPNADALMTEGALACLAGDAQRGADLLASDSRRHRATALRLECALRAGDSSLVPGAAADDDPPTGLFMLYRAEAALLAGRPAEALRHVAPLDAGVRFDREDDLRLLRAVAHLDADDLDAALDALEPAGLMQYADQLDGPEVYDADRTPMFHEPRALALAERLAARQEQEAQAAAARLQAALAIMYGVRWDPRLAKALARARALAPDWPAPDRVAAVFAYFHGEGPRPFEGEVAKERPERDWEEPWVGREIWMGSDNPNLAVVLAIEDLAADDTLTPQQKLLLMRLQPAATSLSALFFRLTNVVRYGRALGVDVSDREAQLAALRALVDSQPNHRLLAPRSRVF